jgi:quinoprotein glucose dehydrogenase
MRTYLTLCLCAAAGVILAAPEGVAQRGDGKKPQTVADTFVAEPPGVAVETWVFGLEIPWSLAFLPDGRALVSERRGRIRLIDATGKLAPTPYARLDTINRGESGLMGLALHPQFPQTPFVYAMLTREEGGRLENAVIRLRHDGERGAFDRTVIGNIPAGTFHDGGRIAFGPDGMLYIGTGDATRSALAQDPASLAGKILRVTPEGSVPPDNPVRNSPVYSLGHRNVQGLAWHPQTQDLFASEHGPTGEFGLQARDEINVIRAGGNYGWPEVTCAAGRPQFVDPIVCWPGPSVPPGGIAFFRGDLFVATLRSEALVRIGLSRADGKYSAARIERWFVGSQSRGRHGRLRDAVVGPDNALYVLTSNRDGRGEPRPGDDRILKLTPR